MKGQPTTSSESRWNAHGASNVRQLWRLLALAALLLLPAIGTAASNALEEITYSALPGNKVQFHLRMASEAAEPSSFATDSPARLILDFADVAIALPKRSIPVGVGVAHSIDAVQAGGRSRVVINMNEMVPHELRVAGKDIWLTLQSGISREEQEAAAQVSDDLLIKRGGALQAIDFRRGPAGEGRVLVTLPSANTVVDVREQGDRIILDILDAKLPKALHQRLDVVDFATPVQQIESSPVGNNSKINIESAGEYEYLAYQADDLYTVEFRPLTKEEKELQQKQKLVYTGDRLSLNFQNIEVRAVLQLLADFTGLNMVVSDSVGGNITLRLKNVPWDQAMDIILKSKGLSMRRNDNVILVAPTQEIASQEELELASQQKIEELAPLRSEFIQINYAKASDLAALLKSGENRLLSERGQVTVDNRTNTLLLQDTAAKLEDIRRMILKLDIPVRQVLIESRIVIANNDFAKDLGVRFGWSGARALGDGHEVNIAGGQAGYLEGTNDVYKGTWLGSTSGGVYNAGIALPNGSSAEALLVDLPVTAPSGAVNFLLGKIGSYLLQLELSAMQQEGRGEIVSSPRVITSDQNKATIKQGVEIPYQQATASGATSVSFKEAVLQLEVTPQITPDDRIMMDLKINKDNPDFARQVLGVPPVDTRSVETKVLVDNGETVVLGGVYERTKSFNKEQVPFFGDIPVVGYLFKTTSTQDENSELLIFITPKILKETLSAR
jgi:type IV pilus assembly protein PilQ